MSIYLNILPVYFGDAKGVKEKEEIGLTHIYNELTAKGETNKIQKIHHPKQITKDTALNTLTTQWTT